VPDAFKQKRQMDGQAMKKKIAQVQILGDTWKIIESDELAADLDGLCDYDNKELIISTLLTKEQRPITILHELGHAICYAFGLHLTAMPWQLEEILVESFAKVMAKNFKALHRLVK